MSKQTQSIIHDFAAESPRATYLILGEESFFAQEIVDAAEKYLTDAASKSFNYDIFYGADSNGGDVLSTCLALPMMATRRVVIVFDFEHLKIEKPDRFASYLENPEQSTTLILIATKLDGRKVAHAAAKKHAVVLNALPLKYERDVSAWIQQNVAAENFRIDPAACHLLYEHIGHRLSELYTQLAKIKTYKGQDTHITLDDVAIMTGISKEYNKYELVNALLMNQKAKALKTLSVLLEQGNEPVVLISTMYFGFKKQWIAKQLVDENKSNDVAKALGLSSYPAKLHVDRCRTISMTRLTKSIRILAANDYKLKTSAGKPDLTIRFAVHQLLEVQ
jgi:DNA polymerase-3 subunit delta